MIAHPASGTQDDAQAGGAPIAEARQAGRVRGTRTRGRTDAGDADKLLAEVLQASGPERNATPTTTAAAAPKQRREFEPSKPRFERRSERGEDFAEGRSRPDRAPRPEAPVPFRERPPREPFGEPKSGNWESRPPRYQRYDDARPRFDAGPRPSPRERDEWPRRDGSPQYGRQRDASDRPAGVAPGPRDWQGFGAKPRDAAPSEYDGPRFGNARRSDAPDATARPRGSWSPPSGSALPRSDQADRRDYEAPKQWRAKPPVRSERYWKPQRPRDDGPASREWRDKEPSSGGQGGFKPRWSNPAPWTGRKKSDE